MAALKKDAKCQNDAMPNVKMTLGVIKRRLRMAAMKTATHGRNEDGYVWPQ
jgi:hypothetical protein